MLKVLRSLRRLLGGGQTNSTTASDSSTTASVKSTIVSSRPSYRSDSIFQAGDRVLFSWNRNKEEKSKLSHQLRLNERTIIENHDIYHDLLIGKWEHQSFVRTRKGTSQHTNISVRQPSLEEFVSLAPRKVAPIYASYASTILALLDIHVAPPDASNDPQTTRRLGLEILEAGTGHGSVTLHLARAIAAANPPPPMAEKPDLRLLANATPDQNKYARQQADALNAWATWRETRRAVIHTVEIDKTTRFHAEKLIRSFRGGLYWPHINFYADNIVSWLYRARKERKSAEFLDIVILDMPNVHMSIGGVSKSLRVNGQMVAFAPQITQIAACVQEIHNNHLPLKLERVIELGDGISNGRSWDVRLAQLRALKPLIPELKNEEAEDLGDHEEETVLSDIKLTGTESSPTSAMVCRPRVGEKIRGGGFIGLWRRVERASQAVPKYHSDATDASSNAQ